MHKISSTNNHFHPLHHALVAAVLIFMGPAAVAQTKGLKPLPPAELAQIRTQRQARLGAAKQIIDRERAGLGLTADDSFEPKSSSLDREGKLHVRLQRYYKGVRVVGADVRVAVGRDGVSGTLRNAGGYSVPVQTVAPAAGEPAVRDTIARDLGLSPAEIEWQFELVILPGKGQERARLAWRVEADAPKIAAQRYYVDAATGKIIRKGPAHVSAFPDAVDSTGNSYHTGQQVPLITKHSAALNKYKLQDSTRGDTFVYDVENKKPSAAFHGTHYWDPDTTWGNGQDWKDGDPTDGPTGQTAAVDAMWGARLTWDTLKNVFSRDGLDDAGSPMRLRVHYREKADQLFNNATWDGYFANFGDGANSDAGDYTAAWIVAHELGHGIWHHEVSDENEGQARGLNEGHGDITSAIVLHYRTLAGGQGNVIPTNNPGNVSLFIGRSINPWSYFAEGQYGLPYYPSSGIPMAEREDHVQGCVYGRMFATLAMGAPSAAEYEAGTPCTAESGAQFKCLVSSYLPQGMVGIGMQKASEIWYRAITQKFNSEPTFHQARDFWIEAAADLFGGDSGEVKAVMNAFHAVNIGDEAPDTENPWVVMLPPPTVNDFEESTRVWAEGTDDIAVHHMKASVGAISRHIPGDEFVGHLDLSQSPLGEKTVAVTAYDSFAKEGTTERNIKFRGANFVIQNRGLDRGQENWTVSNPATIQENKPEGAFLGTGYASFTGFELIRQKFGAPRESTKCTVGYRVRVNPGGNPSQILLVELMESDGTTLRTVLNTILPNTTNDPSSNHYVPYSHNVNDCAARDLWIQFRSVMASADKFRVDNVYVAHHAPPSADFFVEANAAEGSVIFEVKNIKNIDPQRIKRVEIGSPGGIPSADGYAPYIIIKPTSDFVTGVSYDVNASLVDFADDKVFTSPIKKFTVTPVTQLIVNGTFEGGLAWWNTTGAVGHCNFNPAGGEAPEAFIGTGCLWMEGSGSVWQSVDIPAGLGQTDLTFRLKIDKGVAADRFRVKVEDLALGVESELLEIKGNELTTTGVSHMNYQRRTVNLNAYAGKSVRIRFEAFDNAPTPMLFFLDNVGLTHKPAPVLK